MTNEEIKQAIAKALHYNPDQEDLAIFHDSIEDAMNDPDVTTQDIINAIDDCVADNYFCCRRCGVYHHNKEYDETRDCCTDCRHEIIEEQMASTLERTNRPIA